MMKAINIALSVLVPLFFAALWLVSGTAQPQGNPAELRSVPGIEPTPLASTSPVSPIPLTVTVNPQKVALGKKLFFEPRLSRDNSISCASCHALSGGGMDGKRYSEGIAGAKTGVNTPTVFNASLSFRQFWDGRATTLEEQVTAEISPRGEMRSDWPITIAKLKTDASYVKEFGKIYADGITIANVASSIAEFERTLTTPNSRFDKFLRGDETAISAYEKQGFETFKRYGCIGCHQGVLIGGNMFERLGSVRDYYAVRGNVQAADLGHYNVTRQERHRYYFKVPSLRNVEKTAPYFHDGSVTTLEDAVRIVGYYNRGLTIPEKDVNGIAAFLKTLTGEYQGKPL